MSQRAPRDFKDWMKWVNTRLTRIERRLVRLGKGGGGFDTSPFEFDMGSSQLPFDGFVSGGNKQIMFSVPVGRRLPEGTVAHLTKLFANARAGTGGYWHLGTYLAGGRNVLAASGVSVLKVEAVPAGFVYIELSSTTNWWSTNNMVISMGISSMRIEFSTP